MWRRRRVGTMVMLLLASTILLPSRPVRAEAPIGDPIPIGSIASGVAVNPTTNRIYVSSRDGNNVKVIDGTTNTVIGSPIPVGMGPAGIGVNPVTNRIYVANFDSNTVSVIDGATNSVIGSPIAIPPAENGVTAHPEGIGVNPTNNRIYVSNFFTDSVSVIDGSTNTLIGAPIPVFQSPVGVAVNPVTNRVYVAAQSSSDVTVIDSATNAKVGSPIKVGQLAEGITVNPITDRIYVTSFGDGTVTVINGANNTVIGMPIPVSTRLGLGIGLNPGTNLIYLSVFGEPKAVVIDGASNKIVGDPIQVGANPLGLGVNPTTNQIYVANTDSHSVSVIGIPLSIRARTSVPESAVTATWSTLLMPNGADFVGLFAPGAPRSSPLSRRFTNGTAVPGGPGVGAGSTDVAVPAGLAAGNYEVRLVSGVSGATLARMSVVLLVATNDTYTVAAARTLSVPAPGVLSNDTGTDVASLQATVVTNPGHGTLTLQPSGAFTYTPNIFFSGIDTFTYQAASPSGLPSTATVAITVTSAPVGANDAYTVAQGSVLNVPAPGVLANDSDADTPSLQAGVATNPSHGTLALQPSGAFTYTPAAGFSGTDSFTYQVTDQTSISAPVMVALTVTVNECAPRPADKVTTTVNGGKLTAHVQASPLNTQQPNPLKSLRFGTLQNAKVAVAGQPITNGQTVALPANSSTVDLTVERVTPGQATTVPFTVIDGCGEWQTFVGGGPGSGF